MSAPDWRIAGGGGEVRIAPDGVTEGAGPGWTGRYERTTFGPGFHMHLGSLDIERDIELPVQGADEGPTPISLYVCVSGRAKLKMQDWPEIDQKPGHAILFTARGRRSVFRLPGPQTYRFFSVAMAPALMTSLLDDEVPEALSPLVAAHGRATVVHHHVLGATRRGVIADLGEPGEGGALQRLQRESVAIQILAEVVGAQVTEPVQMGDLTPRELAAVKAARDTLLEDLRGAPTAAELANRAGIALRRFLRAFEAIHGESPAQLLRRERLERARLLVEAGDVPLKEIAWRVGYNHLSNFVSAFAEHFGLPPRQFQRTA
jgi:AraC-like DNA-binding protein